MVQDCQFMPLRVDAKVVGVCISIFDVTETSVFEEQLGAALARLHDLSTTDGLTQVFNRRHIEEVLAAEFARARRYRTPLSLAMFDLDHFKQINDQHGHLGGDEVLREVTRRLKSSQRNTDFLGRYGGEEILLVLPQTGGDDALIGVERLRKIISATAIQLASVPVTVTSSVGVAAIHPCHHAYTDMLQAADEALYASKAAGRDRATLAAKK